MSFRWPAIKRPWQLLSKGYFKEETVAARCARRIV